MNLEESYSLFQRKTNKGKVWYFWYYPNVKNSSLRAKKSTGFTKKWQAKKFAEEFLVNLHNSHDVEQKSITFKEFSQEFFVWDTCEWIRGQHEKGKSFDLPTAKMRRGHLQNYLWPKFGDVVMNTIGSTMGKLSAVNVERWITSLSLSNQTKNHILYTLKIVMRHAKKCMLISSDPVADVEASSRNDYKRKDILTLEELRLLFPQDKQELVNIWGSPMFSTLFLLMATTGMRTQEIRALMWKDVLWHEAIVFIERAVKRSGEIGVTKSDYSKAVFLPDRTVTVLEDWKKITLFGDSEDLIFYGTSSDTPLPREKIGIAMKKQLAKFPDITENKLITPHCLRTTYNTYMRQNISEQLLRLQLGHKSEAMTNRYDRGKIIEKILSHKEERAKISEVFKI